MVQFVPHFSPWLLLMLLPFVVVYFWKRPRGFVWRVLTLLAFAGLLLNPIYSQEEREKKPSSLFIVLDETPSQTLGERQAQTQLALKAFENAPFKLKILPVKASNGGSFLFKSLENALADVPREEVAGVIMVTDGQVHDVPKAFAPPLHVLLTGVKNEKDRRLILEEAPKFAFVKKTITLKLRVEDTPKAAGRARIKIMRQGEVPLFQTVPLGESVTLTLPVTTAGENSLEFEVEPLAGELTLINNRALVTFEGVRERLRVQLISGAPHAGERTWRNLLKSDAGIDLVHFTILRPPHKPDPTPTQELALIAFPHKELFVDKINEFDLIIFDRYAQSNLFPLAYYNSMVNYVRQGGAMLIAAGPEYQESTSPAFSSLERILPALPLAVREDKFNVTRSLMGQRHPVTRELALDKAAPWHRYVVTQPLRGQNLLNANQSPLLLLSREGKGRMGLLLSDHLWLWARGVEGGGPHVELTRRLAHWLMQEPELEEERLRLFARGDALMIEQQTLADKPSPLTLTSPSQFKTAPTLLPLSEGKFGLTLPNAELGTWKAENERETKFFTLGVSNPKEWEEVVSTSEKLKPIATSMYRIEEGVPALSSLKLNEKQATRLVSVSLTPLLMGLLGFCLLIPLLLGLWIKEGR